MPEPLRFDGLKIAASWRCNALCAHCAVSSGPRRCEALAPDRVLACIDDAAELGMRVVEFTGGEPLLHPRELAAFMERAHGHGLRVVLDTNAFWATTPDTARRRLGELRRRGLARIALSTDRFHQAFIPLPRVVHALEAARELGIAASVTVCHLKDDPTLLETVAVLYRSTPHIDFQAVAPSGRASALPRERMLRLPAARAGLPCHGMTPTVTPEGRVTLCCAPPMYLPVEAARVSPLVLGWLDEEPLAHILRRAQENPFLQLLESRGTGEVLARLDRLLPGVFQPRAEGYCSSCDLCVEVLGSGPLLSRIGPLLPALATAGS